MKVHSLANFGVNQITSVCELCAGAHETEHYVISSESTQFMSNFQRSQQPAPATYHHNNRVEAHVQELSDYYQDFGESNWADCQCLAESTTWFVFLFLIYLIYFIVGRNPDKLNDVSTAIRAKFGGIEIKTVVVDFSGDLVEGVKRIEEVIEGLEVGVLINNVGVSYHMRGFFMKWMRNCCLMWGLPGMLKRKRGGIINIGFGAAIVIPSDPLYSLYAAAKAVPILKPYEYPIWKVRMSMFLEDTDPEYLDRINEGPYKPTKLSIIVADQPAQTVPKEKSEYTTEDISSIANDAKVRHLLHSAIDNVMSNMIINCKTAKEIWDALETRCQGTDSIKKNMRTILTQVYEHFDSKPDESLTGLYDRFVKLLNDLSLVDKEYDLEDTNLKFLLALPESWDLKATTIRDNYALDETTLDEIYGMLKTYELEMDQRSKRHGRKSRTVALKAEEESPKVAISKKGKGKALITKSVTESSSPDSDEDLETESLSEIDPDEEMMKLRALMVKGITNIVYRKFRRGKKFSTNGASSDKKGFKKSEGKGEKSDIGGYSNIKCYNCGEKGHISPDCKKGKSDKGKALVTKRKSWINTLDSESEVNYALMANADSSSKVAELKVPQTTYAFHTDDNTELRRYLKTMFISYRDQTLTCERLTSENLAYKKRNDYLEKETTQNLLSSRNWKEGLGYGDDKNNKGTVEIKPIVVKQKPKVNPVKFVAVKSDINKSEVKEKLTSDKPKHDKPTEVNIGLMTKKQLKDELKDVKNVNKGNRKNILVLDSGCSGHMTGKKALLSDFVEKAGPGVSYGDDNMGKTLGYGIINLGNATIEKVALVSGLKHNLPSVSQICDRGYHVDFFEEHCEVISKSTGKVVLKGYRHGTFMKPNFQQVLMVL
ncbi:hypothetical protein AgCh_000848 [Apium graveolens]